MSLDDPRVEWLREKVCLGLNITDYEVFFVKTDLASLSCCNCIMYKFKKVLYLRMKIQFIYKQFKYCEKNRLKKKKAQKKKYTLKVFGELLTRNDGENELRILHFFNESSDDEGTSTLLFYARTVEEQQEVEIEYGTFCICLNLLFWQYIFVAYTLEVCLAFLKQINKEITIVMLDFGDN